MGISVQVWLRAAARNIWLLEFLFCKPCWKLCKPFFGLTSTCCLIIIRNECKSAALTLHPRVQLSPSPALVIRNFGAYHAATLSLTLVYRLTTYYPAESSAWHKFAIIILRLVALLVVFPVAAFSFWPDSNFFPKSPLRFNLLWLAAVSAQTSSQFNN